MKLAGEYEVYMHSETMRVVKPYLFLAGFAIIWAVMIFKTKFPRLGTEKNNISGKGGSFSVLLKYPRFWKGVLAQFFYVGAQVGTWSYFIYYVQDYTDQNEKIAGYLLTGTLVVFGVGRMLSAWLMRYFRPLELMGLYSVINGVLITFSIFFPGWGGMIALFLTSFFMSLMYPTIFATSIKELDKNTKIGSSILVMAIIGGALFKPLMGYIAEITESMAIAMSVPLTAYCYIGYFSFSSSSSKTIIQV